MRSFESSFFHILRDPKACVQDLLRAGMRVFLGLPSVMLTVPFIA